MMIKTSVEFSGGSPIIPLMTVDPKEITVHAYHPNRSQLLALSFVATRVATTMGTDDNSSPELVSRLLPRTGPVASEAEELPEVPNVARN